MDRSELRKYILDTYGTEPERLFRSHPRHEIFRHQSNRKWFAIVMDVSGRNLGQDFDEKIDIVNFKCEFLLIDSLLGQKGFFPAYHMNKSNWISVALDGSVGKNQILSLLEMSYRLTKSKR